jgi:heme exporter protein D
MSYQGYVTAAYLVFAAVLLWDFIAPRIRIRQLLRAARLLAARRAAAAVSSSHTSPGELPR